MRRIAVINQKGGVGKTTTTVNVGAALARAGQRVLMIDLDPQAHMTLHYGLNPADGRPGVYELLAGTANVATVRTRVANNLWVIGASIDLAAAEVELVSIVGREVILRDLLLQHTGEPGSNPAAAYDYIIMDCPPSLGVLTLNGLCAAREVIIPLQPHYLALQGLSKLLETVSLVDRRINPDLKVGGVVICMKETGTRLGTEVVEDVRGFLEASRGTPVPWRDARVFETSIRRNIKLAEAPSYGQSILDYAPDSNGAKDYEQLALEIHDPAAFAARCSAATASSETAADDSTLAGSPSGESPADSAPTNAAESQAPEPQAEGQPAAADVSAPASSRSHDAAEGDPLGACTPIVPMPHSAMPVCPPPMAAAG